MIVSCICAVVRGDAVDGGIGLLLITVFRSKILDR
jgi:hypothetical protein